MTYTVSALSLDGDIELTLSSAAAALEFAMRLGSRGCRAISITDPDGLPHDVTSFYRLQEEPRDPRVKMLEARAS